MLVRRRKRARRPTERAERAFVSRIVSLRRTSTKKHKKKGRPSRGTVFPWEGQGVRSDIVPRRKIAVFKSR